MNVAAEFTTLLNGLDGLWLPALDALIKVSLVLGLAGPRDARARPRVGRSPPSRVDPGADERARASGPLGRASALAAADRHV